MRCQLNARILAAYGVLAQTHNRWRAVSPPEVLRRLPCHIAVGSGFVLVKMQPDRHTIAIPNSVHHSRIARAATLFSIGDLDDLDAFIVEVIRYPNLGSMVFVRVGIFFHLLFGCPGGVTGATETIVQKPFDFICLRFKIQLHHISHQLVSMRLQKHRHARFTMPLLAEIG